MGKTLTERQRAALEAGRARRAAQLAAARSAGVLPDDARPEAFSSRPSLPPMMPSTTRADAPSAGLTASSAGLSATAPTDPPAPSPAPPHGADLLAVMFEAASGRTAAREEETRAPRRPPSVTGAERREAEVDYASDGYTDILALVFVLTMIPLVGQELAPSDEVSHKVMAPLARILVRHVPLLRTASDDAQDAQAFLAALGLYLYQVGPEIGRRRQERRLRKVASRNVRHISTAPSQRAGGGISTGAAIGGAGSGPGAADVRAGADAAGAATPVGVADPAAIIAQATGYQL